MEDKARLYIIELFKIVDTKSILIVMQEGKVKRLYCLFRAVCLVEVPPLAMGHEYSVEAVKMTLKLEEVFIIDGKGYFAYYFKIIV